LNNDKARRIRLRPVVAYPAVSVALVVAVALVVSPFGPSQVVALAATSVPTDITATSPAPTTTSTPSPTSTPPSASTPAPTASTPSPVPGLAPNLVPVASAPPGNHHVLARIEGPELQANYLPVDEPVVDAAQFQTFRVRFRLHNAGTVPLTKTPRLEYRSETGAGFAVVPEKPELGIPFYVDREWVPSLGLGGGTKQGPVDEDIAVASLRIGAEDGLAVNGHRSMGANPDRPITLPPASYTEEEFTVTLSIDAKYLTGYELRITNGGTPLTGTDVATIRLGSPPALVLSPGQRQGVAVGAPKALVTPVGVK
jgi:hypothetical protein